MKNKPFYVHGVIGQFKKKDILILHSCGGKLIVVNPKCKDRWWRKLLRYFGFKIFNPTGCIKIKKYDR